MKIIAIIAKAGKVLYVSRQGVSKYERGKMLSCNDIFCDDLDYMDCRQCPLRNLGKRFNLDSVEHYVYNCETNKESANKYKEVMRNEQSAKTGK